MQRLNEDKLFRETMCHFYKIHVSEHLWFPRAESFCGLLLRTFATADRVGHGFKLMSSQIETLGSEYGIADPFRRLRDLRKIPNILIHHHVGSKGQYYVLRTYIRSL